MAEATLSEGEDHLRAVIQNLYSLIVQTANHQGPASVSASKNEVASLVGNLATLARASPGLAVDVPPEGIIHVQEGKNPDIYTRDMIEVTQRYNQLLKGKSEAFGRFRDVFAQHLAAGIPELRDEVRRVVESTGGVLEDEEGKGEGDVPVKKEET